MYVRTHMHTSYTEFTDVYDLQIRLLSLASHRATACICACSFVFSRVCV